MTTPAESPPLDDIQRAKIRRAIEDYDYIPLLTGYLNGDVTEAELTDTRLVQARLKHELTQRNCLLQQSAEFTAKGMTMRARELSYFAMLHEATMAMVITYLKAIGADYEMFLAEQPSMFGSVAA